MSDSLTITIHGDPPAYQLGARAFRVRGKWMASIYEKGISKKWKKAAKETLKLWMTDRVRLSGPLQISILAVFACPKSDRRKTLAVPRRWKPSKPDLTNIAKTVEDAANEIVWDDDAMIVDERIRKVYGDQNEKARIIFTVGYAGDVDRGEAEEPSGGNRSLFADA